VSQECEASCAVENDDASRRILVYCGANPIPCHVMSLWHRILCQLTHSLLQKQKDQTRLENFFTQNFCDKQLIEDLEAIRFQISTLNNLEKQHCAIANAEEKVKKAGQKSHKTVTQLSQAKTKLQKETDTTKTNFDRLQEAINQILKGRDSSSLQQTLFRTRNRQKSLKDLLDLISRSNGQSN